MEEPVKKAIEKDQVKPEPRGRLSKGLGEVPGVTHRPVPKASPDPYADFRPVPKPGKK